MPSLRINKENQTNIHFLTFTLQEWMNIFTSEHYFLPLIENIEQCTTLYELKVYGYVFMTNHIHLILQSDKLVKFVNSFKSYSSKEIINLIALDNRPFLNAFIKRNKNSIWQKTNHPREIITQKFFLEKLNYIHNNPIRAGYVINPEDYKYSSARNYILNDHSVMKVNTTLG